MIGLEEKLFIPPKEDDWMNNGMQGNELLKIGTEPECCVALMIAKER